MGREIGYGRGRIGACLGGPAMLLALTLTSFFLACDDATPTPSADVPAATAEATAEATVEAEPAAPAAAVAGEWSHYGAPFALTEVKTAADVLGSPATFADQTVLVEGKITDVCQKAGCWMVITDDTRTMRVLMKDHAFSVDKGGAGALCRVEGQIVAKEIDPATVAHFESESADTQNMPEKQATSSVVYELHATGVEMKKSAG